jgi:hypothetical protein
MKLLFTLLFAFVALGGVFGQTTEYTTGQTYSDPWTGWSNPITTGITATSVNGADVYTMSGNTSDAYTFEIKRQFTINSNDIDLYLAATTQNATVSIEYSSDDVTYTQIGTQNWGAGFAQSSLIVPTYDPVVSTFYLKLKISGTFASPSQAQFNNLKIDAELNAGSSVSIAPTTTQNIAPSSNGTVLTATEAPSAATSREWKYSTTSGSGYVSFGTPETGSTYTPNFATVGTYYVICESDFSGTVETSNEVEINVSGTFTVEETALINSMTFVNNNLIVKTEEKNYQISIYNLQGQLMINENNMTSYAFSNLPRGMYIVRMTTTNGKEATLKVSSIE